MAGECKSGDNDNMDTPRGMNTYHLFDLQFIDNCNFCYMYFISLLLQVCIVSRCSKSIVDVSIIQYVMSFFPFIFTSLFILFFENMPTLFSRLDDVRDDYT